MWSSNFLILIIFLIPNLIVTLAEDEAKEENSMSHGLGDKYEWVKLDDGFKLAKESNKPLMLIIHKSWCGACRALKPKFAESEIIFELSKKFVMVNVMDDEEPEGSQYKPNGAGYIPRIIFFNSEGEPLNEITNELGNEQYPYYYYNEEGISASMKTCLQKIEGKGEKEEDSAKSDHTEL